MSANTKIEWADHTFNPWIGCTKVSSACDHCYAEGWAKRSGMVQWGPHAARRRTSEATWSQPLKWNREAERLGIRYRVFSASLADWLDLAVEIRDLVDLLELVRVTTNLDWLLLSKRIGNLRKRLQDAVNWIVDSPLAAQFKELARWLKDWLNDKAPENVWVGATICNQEEAERDIPKLLAVPAAKRFLSMEPLLGSVRLESIYNTDLGEGQPYLHPLIGRVSDGHGDGCNVPQIDWVIVGGESGHGARPMHPNWVRSLRDQCQAAGVPFLFKQHGEWLATAFCDDDMAMIPSRRTVYVRKDGRVHDGGAGVDFFGGDEETAWVGKKAAGRLLDGREWNEVPA